jgi:hypothetical protein
MGSQAFFKGQGKGPSIGGSGNTALEARAIGSSVNSARSAGIAAQKDVGAADAINKAAFKSHGPLKRSAAYPKGPKV